MNFKHNALITAETKYTFLSARQLSILPIIYFVCSKFAVQTSTSVVNEEHDACSNLLLSSESIILYRCYEFLTIT